MARRVGDQILLTIALSLAALAMIMLAVHNAGTGRGHAANPKIARHQR